MSLSLRSIRSFSGSLNPPSRWGRPRFASWPRLRPVAQTDPQFNAQPQELHPPFLPPEMLHHIFSLIVDALHDSELLSNCHHPAHPVISPGFADACRLYCECYRETLQTRVRILILQQETVDLLVSRGFVYVPFQEWFAQEEAGVRRQKVKDLRVYMDSEATAIDDLRALLPTLVQLRRIGLCAGPPRSLVDHLHLDPWELPIPRVLGDLRLAQTVHVASINRYTLKRAHMIALLSHAPLRYLTLHTITVNNDQLPLSTRDAPVSSRLSRLQLIGPMSSELYAALFDACGSLRSLELPMLSFAEALSAFNQTLPQSLEALTIGLHIVSYDGASLGTSTRLRHTVADSLGTNLRTLHLVRFSGKRLFGDTMCHDVLKRVLKRSQQVTSLLLDPLFLKDDIDSLDARTDLIRRYLATHLPNLAVFDVQSANEETANLMVNVERPFLPQKLQIAVASHPQGLTDLNGTRWLDDNHLGDVATRREIHEAIFTHRA